MTIVLAGPSISVDGPTPQAPEYRLLDTAEVRTNDRALLGADVWSYPTGLGKLYAPCLTGSFADKDLDNEMLSPRFGSFGVYYPVTCSALGLDLDEIVTRARVTADAVESEAVEREFRNGIAQPDNPFLNDTNLDILNTGDGPRVSLAILERAIAGTGRKGMIHVDPGVATALAGANLVTTNGVMRTMLGTPVVVGHGYYTDNSGDDLYAPDGGANAVLETSGWAYATGPVIVYKGSELALRSVGHDVNDYEVVIEREYLVEWDTALQAAVLIDFTTEP